MSVVTDFSSQYTKNIPDLKTGLTVRVHQKIQEGDKARIQVFEGLIIRISSGASVDKTFTVRKVVDGVGVEKIFPLHSTNIAKIEVKKVHRTRRSKLYYMKDRQGKSANLRDLQGDVSQFSAEEVASEEKGEKEAVATGEAPVAVPEERQSEKSAPPAQEKLSEKGKTE